MKFSQAITPNLIKVDLKSYDKKGCLDEMAQFFVESYPEVRKSELLSAIYEREQQVSTGILTHIAVPHCRIKGVKNSCVCLGISKKGIDYGSLDSEPVFLVMMMVVPSSGSESHLELLKNLALMTSDESFIDNLLKKETPQEVFDYLSEKENSLK